MTAVPVLARTLKYSILISRGENAGQIYSFEQALVTIGRGPENSLVFANDPKMSRQHAELRIQMGQLYVRNISGKNFILVDGERTDEKVLTKPAEIQIGDVVLTIKLDVPQAKSQLTPPPKAVPAISPPSTAANVFQSPVRIAGGAASQIPVTNPTATATSTASNAFVGAGADREPGRPTSSKARVNLGGGSLMTGRVRFYLIVAVVGGLFYWFVSSNDSSKRQEVNLRTEGDVARAIDESMNAVRELKKQQEKTGQDSLQFKAAQEHYIRGFRDYRQGQYARAMQSFQAALSFYPAHDLARKYLVQAQRKFDEVVDLNLSQGRKYYQRQNFRRCQSAFANVMIMVKDSTKAKYKEAKQFYDECSLRTEGRFNGSTSGI